MSNLLENNKLYVKKYEHVNRIVLEEITRINACSF